MPAAVTPALPPPERDASACELDAAALSRLRELDPSGHNHVVQRVMVAFESSLMRLMQQAEDAEAENDLGAIRHVAHTLKSSSASVGALELSAQCALIEQHLREHRTEQLAQQLGMLRSEAERALRAVKATLTE
jgi:HPt (histidine-containing phosphotransfer) domain-containing protein